MAAQSFTVAVSGPDSASVTGGASTSISVDVNLMGDEFGCVMDTDLPVTVSATATRATATVGTPELAFTVPAGTYNSQVPGDALPPYNATQSSSVNVQVPSGQTSGFTEQVTISASFPGGDYSPAAEGSCGPGSFPAAEGSTTVDVQVTPDAAGGGSDGGDGTDGTDGGDGGDGTDGGNGGSMDGGDGGEDTDDSPIGAWIVPLALLGAAFAFRRER